ncbi:MAG: hypothetical protein NT002_10685 [candidate division Zixibacteria bacterium]|nr:hypothetical protein [candidate division Zixibacteria bacterium]
MNKNKPYNALRWTARIYGTLVVALLLYLTSIEYIEELNGGASPLASLFTLIHEIMKYPHIFLPWVIAGVCLILAQWKEVLGGGISLISSGVPLLVYLHLVSLANQILLFPYQLVPFPPFYT